jgi:hypothetical protein
VQLEEIREDRTRRPFILRGKIRNEGRTRVDRIKVSVEWQDSAGKVLDTSVTTVVSSTGLEPGQAKSWSVVAPKDRRITQYHIYIPVE